MITNIHLVLTKHYYKHFALNHLFMTRTPSGRYFYYPNITLKPRGLKIALIIMFP